MGNAVGVSLPPGAVASVRRASSVALVQAKHAAVLAHLHTVQIIRLARRYYEVVDERVLSRVQRIVEREVLRRVNLFMDHVEVKSKLLFVKHISNTSIAQAYNISVADVRQVQISKRKYEVYNCGPELPNVPSLNTVLRSLELRDKDVVGFLLNKCVWTPWEPTISWRTKTDQTFDLTVHEALRCDGFLTGEIRVIKLRMGRKWVGPHHHDTMDQSTRGKWLHRTDYEIRDSKLTAESVFFQTVKTAWQDFLDELARQPKEDLELGDETGNAFAYDEQEKRTSLRVKYLVETSVDRVMNDHHTMFRSAPQFELWRMEQEDKPEHQSSNEHDFAGPILDDHIDVLAEYYEAQAMATEDVKIWV